MKKEKENRSGGWKRVLLTIICVLLALILVGITVAGAYVNHLLGKVDRVQMGSEPTMSPSQVEDILSTDPELTPIDPTETLPNIEDATFPTEPQDPEKKPDHIINIMLVGQDARKVGVRARSDSMILVTINTKSNAVTFTSFMRDSYVQIPGYAANKLNHTYQYGGMKLLNETLKLNFGVEVDGNIEVNFAQFEKIIDLMGGVEINLTHTEAEYINLTDRSWGLTKGVHRLNGKQALAYSRLREFDSDYQRTGRQRKVLMALVEAYKNQPVDRMFSLLEELMGMVTTNMTDAQIWEYGMKVIPVLSGINMSSQQIPAFGTFSQGNAQVRPGLKGWFQYNIDFDANRELLKKIFNDE